MSISSALSNALSGLQTSSRAADIVSSNVANALTEGYARRTLEIAPKTVAGASAGVQILGTVRNVDLGLLQDRRMADAALGASTTTSGFLGRMEQLVGTPDDAGSLNGRLASLDSSLIEAQARPDSEARLSSVLGAAKAVVSQIGSISDGIQSARLQADGDIASAVETINDALVRVADLNQEIRMQTSAGVDTSGLMDLRQQQVDRIAPLMPLREIQREGNQIALYTRMGSALVETEPAVLSFSAVNGMTENMTIADGSLSGLSLNGRAVALSGEASPIMGGALAANFALRDADAPALQEKIDAIARNLVERFQSTETDPTLGTGAAGLFTDSGTAFDSVDETGLAGRLAINDLVDPAAGGGLWKLRDGLGAIVPGPVGHAAGLAGLQQALNSLFAPQSGGFLTAARSMPELAAEFLSFVGQAHQSALSDTSFAAARHSSLKTLELQNGVDTDQEMQSLLLIEQAYAANARVIQAVDEMLQSLTRI